MAKSTRANEHSRTYVIDLLQLKRSCPTLRQPIFISGGFGDLQRNLWKLLPLLRRP